MSDDYLWDKSGPEDPEIRRLEEALAGLRHDAPLAPKGRPPAPRRRVGWLAGALALAAALGLGLFLLPEQPVSTLAFMPTAKPLAPSPCASDPTAGGVRFAATGGQALCGESLFDSGPLPPGAWLETPRGAEARVEVDGVFVVTMREESKLRVVTTGPHEQRLELARGAMHAKVDAPPRLFFVHTPGGTAVDLGCEYDLRLEEGGPVRLFVRSGAVSWEGHGRAVYVPVGAQLDIDLQRGPGLPYVGASKTMLAAVARYDRGDASAADTIIEAAERVDGVTLWALLADGPDEARPRVVAKLGALGLRPSWVQPAAVVAGDPAATQAWQSSLEELWQGGSWEPRGPGGASTEGPQKKAPSPKR